MYCKTGFSCPWFFFTTLCLWTGTEFVLGKRHNSVNWFAEWSFSSWHVPGNVICQSGGVKHRPADIKCNTLKYTTSLLRYPVPPQKLSVTTPYMDVSLHAEKISNQKQITTSMTTSVIFLFSSGSTLPTLWAREVYFWVILGQQRQPNCLSR